MLVLGACRGEFVSRTQPLPLVAAQFQRGFAEPQPEEAVLTLWLRRATSVGTMSKRGFVESLPTTAERLVQLDYAQQFVQPNLPEIQFRLEQIAIGVERIELGIHTAGISCIRQAFPIFESRDQRLLRNTAFSHPLVSNQGVRHFCKRGLDRLLILNERAVSLGLRESDVRSQTSGREYRLRDLRHKAPRAVRTAEQA